jgi:hypothetical protein
LEPLEIKGYLYNSEYLFSNIKVVYGNEGCKEINISIQNLHIQWLNSCTAAKRKLILFSASSDF